MLGLTRKGVVSGMGVGKLEKLDMQFDGKGREVKKGSGEAVKRPLRPAPC